MVIKANSLNNAATKCLAHCQISRLKKSCEICASSQILQTFIFTFLLEIYNLKPMALFTNSMKKCIDIENVGSVKGSTHFSLQNDGKPIEYSKCLPYSCFNKFILNQKNLIVFFVTKQYQPFCVTTGGDAQMKLPRSCLLPSIEVGLCYLRKRRRGESLIFILIQAQSM